MMMNPQTILKQVRQALAQDYFQRVEQSQEGDIETQYSLKIAQALADESQELTIVFVESDAAISRAEDMLRFACGLGPYANKPAQLCHGSTVLAHGGADCTTDTLFTRFISLLQQHYQTMDLDHDELAALLDVTSGMPAFIVRGLLGVVLRRSHHPKTMSMCDFLRALVEASRDLDDIMLKLEGEAGFLAIRNDVGDAHRMIANLLFQGVQPAPKKPAEQENQA